MGLLVSDTMTSIASLVIALYYSWKLTFVIFVTLPISTVVLSLVSRRVQPAIQSQKRDLATASKYATASITAIDLVKIFNGYDKELWQYTRATKMAAKHYLVQAKCNSIQVGYVSFWVVSMFVVGFTYGVVLVNEGMEAGQVVTTFYATLASFQGIEALVPHWLVLAKGIAAGGFLSDLISDTEDGKSFKRMDGGIRPERCVGAVELKNVSIWIACHCLVSPAHSPLGQLRIPFESNKKSPRRSIFFLPTRGDDLYRWPKRVREEYTRQYNHQPLRSQLWRSQN